MELQQPIFNFTNNLRKLMTERQIQLGELARAIQVPKSTIHGWMYGRNPGDLVALKKIADFFFISVDEICFGDHDQKSTGIIFPEIGQKHGAGQNIGTFDVILLKRQTK